MAYNAPMKNESKPLTIATIWTWDTSLASRQENGHLGREKPYYDAMARRGIRMLTLTWGGKRDLELAKEFPPTARFIPFHASFPRPGSRFLRLAMSPLILWPARHALRECDFIKTEQMVGGWCAVLAKFIFRKPLVVRTGYEFHKFTIARGKGFFRRAFSYAISKFTYAFADLIFVTSRDDADFIARRFRIAPERIRVLPNWTDIKKFSPPPPSKAREKGRILFVGRLDPQKNLPLLIDAVAGHPWRLTIIGDGPLKDEIKTLAAQKKVEAEFTGNIPNDGLVAHYRRCSVYVLPSRFEGHPKTLLEAMACGCAVIGTDVDGVRPVIRDGVDGFIVGENVASLRGALEKLMGDAGLRARLGKAAAKAIRSELSLDILLDREVGHYAKMRG